MRSFPGVLTALVLPLMLPLPALAGAADDVAGDEWKVTLAAPYEDPQGALVLLRATWTIWSPWPIPYYGYEHRLRDLEVLVGLTPLQDPTVRFWALAGGPTPVFRVTLEAEGLFWEQAWTWTLYSGCGYNKVTGTVRDLGTTLDGQPLQAATAGLVPFDVGASEPSGPGLAEKTGPGDDGLYECWPGNI
jgi:hypothetical protein